jgi:hypothetical protein
MLYPLCSKATRKFGNLFKEVNKYASRKFLEQVKEYGIGSRV